MKSEERRVKNLLALLIIKFKVESSMFKVQSSKFKVQNNKSAEKISQQVL